jgi:hypothetical protein
MKSACPLLLLRTLWKSADLPCLPRCRSTWPIHTYRNKMKSADPLLLLRTLWKSADLPCLPRGRRTWPFVTSQDTLKSADLPCLPRGRSMATWWDWAGPRQRFGPPDFPESSAATGTHPLLETKTKVFIKRMQEQGHKKSWSNK